MNDFGDLMVGEKGQKAYVTKFVRDWIRALRSGSYEQGSSFLKRDGRYCCLGVACEVAGLAEKEAASNKLVDTEPITTTADERIAVFSFFGHDSDTHLPIPLREMIDMDGAFQSRLTERNDEGSSFEEIADLIEQYYREKGYVL